MSVNVSEVRGMTPEEVSRAEVIAYGDVQRVGYRYVVQDIARRLGIRGYVENVPDGTVKMVAEGPKRDLKAFVEAVKVREPPIDVKELKVTYGKPTGEFECFAIRYGEQTEEIAQGFGAGFRYIGLVRVEMREGFKGMHEDMQGMRGEMGEMRKEMREGFDATRKAIVDMHADMSRGFEEMAKRYDAISAELIRTREELTRVVNGLLRLVEEFIREARRGRATQP